jgi:hypothetical protein
MPSSSCAVKGSSRTLGLLFLDLALSLAPTLTRSLTLIGSLTLTATLPLGLTACIPALEEADPGAAPNGSPSPRHTLSASRTFPLAGYNMISWARDGKYKRSLSELFSTRGWALELAYLTDPPPEVFSEFDPGYDKLARVDWDGSMTIPPIDKTETYLSRIGTLLGQGAQAVLVGNEPNMAELCNPADGNRLAACGPARYAEVYAAVKNRYPDAFILMSGPTPDISADPNQVLGHMWMRGEKWLDQSIAEIKMRLGHCPDAFGLHAYADYDSSNSVPAKTQMKNYFRLRLNLQLAAIRKNGCQSQPVIITEYNPQPQLKNYDTEKSALDAIFEGLTQNPEWRSVVSLIYFVLEGEPRGWPDYSALTRGMVEVLKYRGTKAFTGAAPVAPEVKWAWYE